MFGDPFFPRRWGVAAGGGGGDDARVPEQPSWYMTPGFRVLIAGLLSHFFGG
jgi:hypothetical protein